MYVYLIVQIIIGRYGNIDKSEGEYILNWYKSTRYNGNCTFGELPGVVPVEILDYTLNYTPNYTSNYTSNYTLN